MFDFTANLCFRSITRLDEITDFILSSCYVEKRLANH